MYILPNTMFEFVILWVIEYQKYISCMGTQRIKTGQYELGINCK